MHKDREVTPGSRGLGQGRPVDRELQLRVTGNYYKSPLETAQLSQHSGLILRVALPQSSCIHDCSHVLATHSHRMCAFQGTHGPSEVATGLSLR